MWRYVALCGTIRTFHRNQKKAIFHTICVMCANCVALCGTMWHYVALFSHMLFHDISVFFDVFLCGAMWRYVALCGTIRTVHRNQKELFFTIFARFVQIVWHYVALCGTMWHYFNTCYFMIFWCFLMFSCVALCGTMWHYVALLELFIETKKELFFTIFARFVQIVWHYVALCGTMWHYVALF